MAAGAALAALAVAPPAFADVSASATGDLGISVSTPGPVLSGVATTYTLSVTNNSPVEFDSVLSGGSLSNGMTLNGFGLNDNCARSNSNAGGVLRGPGFSCVLGTGGSVSAGQTFPPGNILAPGASTSWTFTATASKPGLYTAHVTGSGLFPFGNPLGNGRMNAVDLTIPVDQGPIAGGGGGGGVPTPSGAADLALTGSASNGSPALGSPFSYKFQAKNNGKGDASAATFDDPLPLSVTGTSVSTDTGTCALDQAANGVHCDLGTLAVGKQATITVNATAPSVAGAVTNTASSATTSGDSNPANNNAAVTVQPK